MRWYLVWYVQCACLRYSTPSYLTGYRAGGQRRARNSRAYARGFAGQGKCHDVRFLDALSYEHGAYYVMDRGYTDFARFHAIHEAGAYFVTRAKKNIVFERVYSHPARKDAGVRCDQTIRLAGQATGARYPDLIRRIKYHDAVTDRTYVFLTNGLYPIH